MGHLLLVAEVSAILRCGEATVRKYLREGGLIGHRVGGHWRVFQTDLGNFISEKPMAAARHIPCLDQPPSEGSKTASVEPAQPLSISLNRTTPKPKGVAT